MKIFLLKLATTLCTIQILVQLCKCLDVPYASDIDEVLPKSKTVIKPILYEQFRPIQVHEDAVRTRVYEDEKDLNLKEKIAVLINQTMRDTGRRIEKTDEIKDKHRDESPYRVGFILCMIKKSKNQMDELYNVAVKRKQQWKSLKHLKIFEMIVHTNVDQTNLLRQLVDVHLKHVNSTEEHKKKKS